VGLVYTNWYKMNFEGDISVGIVNFTPPSINQNNFFFHLETYKINLQTVVIRRKYLNNLAEIFDEGLEVCEETDLILRLSHYCKFAYLDLPLSTYRIHGNNSVFRNGEILIAEIKYILSRQINIRPELELDITKKSTGLLDSAYWNAAVASLMNFNQIGVREHIRGIKNKKIKHFLLHFASYSMFLSRLIVRRRFNK
jgi:hypothetical protein